MRDLDLHAAHKAASLLVAAARIDPTLREAATTVQDTLIAVDDLLTPPTNPMQVVALGEARHLIRRQDERVSHLSGLLAAARALHPREVLAAGTDHERVVCGHCIDGYEAPEPWPCPDRQALDGIPVADHG